MHCLHGLHRRGHALEQENQRKGAQRHHAEQEKIIHIRQQMRLLVEQRIDGGVSLMRCGHWVGVVGEQVLRAGETFREGPVGGGEVADQERLVRLRAAGERGGDERDAEAAAEVARQIVEAGGVAQLLLVQLAHRDHRERHENEADGDAVDDARPDDIDPRHVHVDPAQHEGRRRKQHEPETQHPFRAHFSN